MKKLLLASAVAALSVTAAQAAPTLYGKAFLTLDVANKDTETTVAGVTTKSKTDGRGILNSNGSRIGIKGATALTANTDVVYQLEYGVDIDDGADNFTSRDTFVGLSNKQYGTLLAGRLSAIDGQVDYANVTTGAVVGGGNVLASFDKPRANNTVAYVSPNYNGFNVLGMYVADEDSPTKGVDTFGRDVVGAAVKFEPAGAAYRGGASYIQSGATKIARVSGAFDVSPAITVGALYQTSKYSALHQAIDADDLKGNATEKALTVSGSLKTATPWSAYAQLDLVDNYKAYTDSEAKRIAVGGQYAFSAATTGHVYGAALNTTTNNGTTKTEVKSLGIGAGIEHKF